MNWLQRIFRKTAAPDDLADLLDNPGSSLLALSRRQAVLGEALCATVYVYDGKTFLITAVTRPNEGPIIETGAPSVLPVAASNEELGRAICAHLLAYALTDKIDAQP